MKTQIALRLQTLCHWCTIAVFFILPLSIALTSIFYWLSVGLILLSTPPRELITSLRRHPLTPWFVMMSLLYVFGSFYSTENLQGILLDCRKHLWLLVTPLFFIVFENRDTQRHALNAFLLAMILTLFLSYLQFFGYIPARSIFSLGSVFHDHITQNFMMSLMVVILFFRIFYEKKAMKINGVLLLLVVFDILFISSGRTGYVIVMAYLLTMTSIRFGWRGGALTLCLCVSMMGLAWQYSSAFHDRVKLALTHTKEYRVTSEESNSMSLRLNQLWNAWHLIKIHPWIGSGTGSIRVSFNSLPSKLQLSGEIKYTENSFANILLQWGSVGFALYLGLFITLMKVGRHSPFEQQFIYSLFLLGFILGAQATAWFTATAVSHLFSLLTAWAYGRLNAERSPAFVNTASCSLTRG